MIPSQRAKRTAASKAAVWAIAFGLDHPLLDQGAEAGRVAVVAEAAGVDRRRNEVVAERVHRHQRGHPDRVAEVVGIAPRVSVGQAAGSAATNRVSVPSRRRLPQERIGDAGEVGSAADAADDDVGRLARHLHLRDRLLADHRLVQADVVEHRPERVVRVLGLAATSTASEIAIPRLPGIVLCLRAAGLGQIGGAAVDGCAPGLDHRLAVGLLVVGDARP